jgi:hypothetical protein
VFIIWTVIYFWGGWNSPNIVVGPGQGPWLYLLGLLIVALYAPLYWWRAWQDRRLARAGAAPAQVAAASDGAADVRSVAPAEPVASAEPSHDD